MYKTKLLGFIFAVLAVFFLKEACALNEQSQADSFFYQANIAYQTGKYDAAVENYEKIILLGEESGNLYYNLGNSYFKKGELGKAVLNYERAGFFMPNDSDLKANYDYVLSLLNSGRQVFGNRFEKLVNRLFAGVTVNFLTVLLSVIYILVIISFILNLSCTFQNTPQLAAEMNGMKKSFLRGLILRRKVRDLFFSGFKTVIKPVIFILIAVFILAAVSLRSKIAYFKKGGIVISKDADIKFEPLESATTYFKLNEGSPVEVLEETGNWYKIKRADGKLGWVNKGTLGLFD